MVALPPVRTLWMLVLATLFLNGCTFVAAIQESLDTTQKTLVAANKVHARLCAPEELANAQSNLNFSKIELEQGSMRRAGEHLEIAEVQAKLALEKATPCGTADRDEDTIPDVIDVCPDEPEDFDGDRDEDGCRDIRPQDDEDKDTILNIDDACIDDPEDFDGHNDEDGCPETSEDTDGDGLIDAVDPCPEDPEDFDGFRDEDGCPEPDNDGDGVVDIRDNCPMVPEDVDTWQDDDGCPAPDKDSDGVPATPDDWQPWMRATDGMRKHTTDGRRTTKYKADSMQICEGAGKKARDRKKKKKK